MPACRFVWLTGSLQGYHGAASHSPCYTVFFELDKEENLVIVRETLPIEQAHKK
jgi:hypothetical protein